MAEDDAPTRAELPALPFLIGDVLLVGVALLIFWQGQHFPAQGGKALVLWEAGILAGSVFLGACLGVLPYLLRHRAAFRLAEAERLNSAVLQMQNIDQVSRQISSATACWQAVQDDATKAVESAREIQVQTATEAKAFRDFLQRSNDSERQHLRLEVEKLRRAEGEWLQVLVRILDHVHALHIAAVRSGHAALMEQLGNFQHACHDVARRIGLVPFVAGANERFDAELHQPAAAEPAPNEHSRIADTVAAGYRYQGQLIRKAMVVLLGARKEQTDFSIRQIAQRRGDSQPAVLTEGAAANASGQPPAADAPDEVAAAAAPASESDANQQEQLGI